MPETEARLRHCCKARHCCRDNSCQREEAPKREVTTVQLFITRYNELVAAEMKLRALEKQGVHNWIHYDEAMESIPKIEDGPRVVWK